MENMQADIKKLRKSALRVKQADLCRKSGLSRQTIYSFCKGRPMREKNLIAISVAVNDLLGEQNQ